MAKTVAGAWMNNLKDRPEKPAHAGWQIWQGSQEQDEARSLSEFLFLNSPAIKIASIY